MMKRWGKAIMAAAMYRTILLFPLKRRNPLNRLLKWPPGHENEKVVRPVWTTEQRKNRKGWKVQALLARGRKDPESLEKVAEDLLLQWTAFAKLPVKEKDHQSGP
jgi:hypothetical protein